MTAASVVDPPGRRRAAGNFRLTLMAGPAGYAGGGISFDLRQRGVFQRLPLLAWIASGDITGCNFKLQLQTFSGPTSQSPPGLCDRTRELLQLPTSPVTLDAGPTTFTITFTDFTTSATSQPDPRLARRPAVAARVRRGRRSRRRHSTMHRRDPHRRHRLRHAVTSSQ